MRGLAQGLGIRLFAFVCVWGGGGGNVAEEYPHGSAWLAQQWTRRSLRLAQCLLISGAQLVVHLSSSPLYIDQLVNCDIVGEPETESPPRPPHHHTLVMKWGPSQGVVHCTRPAAVHTCSPRPPAAVRIRQVTGVTAWALCPTFRPKVGGGGGCMQPAPSDFGRWWALGSGTNSARVFFPCHQQGILFNFVTLVLKMDSMHAGKIRMFCQKN